jgi:hypothetical protein
MRPQVPLTLFGSVLLLLPRLPILTPLRVTPRSRRALWFLVPLLPLSPSAPLILCPFFTPSSAPTSTSPLSSTIPRFTPDQVIAFLSDPATQAKSRRHRQGRPPRPHHPCRPGPSRRHRDPGTRREDHRRPRREAPRRHGPLPRHRLTTRPPRAHPACHWLSPCHWLLVNQCERPHASSDRLPSHWSRRGGANQRFSECHWLLVNQCEQPHASFDWLPCH